MTQSYDELLAKAAASIESKKPEITGPVYRVDSIFSLITIESGGSFRYAMRATVIHDRSIFGDRGFVAAPNGLAFFSNARGSRVSRWRMLNQRLHGNSASMADRLISAKRFYEMFKSGEDEMPANNRMLREDGRSDESYALFIPFNLKAIRVANIQLEAFSSD